MEWVPISFCICVCVCFFNVNNIMILLDSLVYNKGMLSSIILPPWKEDQGGGGGVQNVIWAT
jgi:hypothetical protein